MSASLLLQSGDVLTRISLRNGGLTIGRLPENDLTLESASIRPRHARIVAAPEGFVLENLNPTGRTMVNDQRIERRVLQHGDRVTLGDYSAVFASDEGREVEPPAAPSHEEAGPVRPPASPPAPAAGEHATGLAAPEAAARPAPATVAGGRPPEHDAVPASTPAPGSGHGAGEAAARPRPPGGNGGPDRPSSPPHDRAPGSAAQGTSPAAGPAPGRDGGAAAAELTWHAVDDAEPLGYLQVVSGSLAGHVMTLSKPRTTLGFKGRRIAVVEHDRGHFRVRRLDSTRTVMLNGDPIGATTTGLKPGDTLELADARLRFSRDRPQSPAGS